ncbi:GntP family permease [Sporolituus thermophilus]|uniref:Gluconate:H+ symporter, GntP family n=1 Tax=Sporolituus thermophilus DSM 23256 TaxID=1123285 RepID=A0A1G7NHP3_9FIRM|nr:gluconate:H+ symporter [Sporolituus thermophilus]SDF73594.1 gluconate:H+ symporter, GntP family [Sporolituus thermophilus DSM 23256]
MDAVSGTQMIIGLVIGVAVLVYLVLRTKIHAFPALIIAAALTGLIGGMPPSVGNVNVVKSITTGFGNTLASIGIVIGFGVMMGRLLEVSGAAERMAYTFLKYFGRGKEEWAMASTGYIVSIPIFCDSGFVILSPLAKALSLASRKSILTIGVALAVGLVATHHAVPPTPGPLAVAGIFKVDVGHMILLGLVFAIPVTIAGVLYAQWLGRKIYQLPTADGTGWERPEYQAKGEADIVAENKELPSAFMSFAPVVVPVVLIIFNTVLSAMKLNQGWAQYLIFLGSPVIAVGIGLIIAIYGLVPKLTQKDVIKRMEEGVTSAGIIILVTGAGGALGQVLRDSGTGLYIAKLIASTALPPVLLPFFVASLVRLVQGSGTVAMITSASITAPILAGMPHVNPLVAAQAAALGAMIYSYFNDSYFWVVNRLLGIEDVKEQTLTWSVPTTIGWAVSLVLVLVADLIF